MHAVFRFVPGLSLSRALGELKMFLAADPDGADKYHEAAKVIGKQVLMVSQELRVSCMLLDLQCLMASCIPVTTAARQLLPRRQHPLCTS